MVYLYPANQNRRIETICLKPSEQHVEESTEQSDVDELNLATLEERRATSQLRKQDLVGEREEAQRKVLKHVRSSTTNKPISRAVSTTGFQSVRGQTSIRLPEKQACFVKRVTRRSAD